MRIGIVAGEPSGDQLGKDLVLSLRNEYPKAIIEGIAGPKMIEAGCKSFYPIEKLSVIGVVEIVKYLPQIFIIRHGLLKYFTNNLPDIYIGIDAPDFNLSIEKTLKKRGVKTIQYVSPSIWAWRKSRIKKIKQATDVVFTILPFEESFYQKHAHKAVFVGHPLAEKVMLHQSPKNLVEARKIFTLGLEKCVIAILPGSRHQEIQKLLPIFIESLFILKQKGIGFSGILSVAKPNLLPLFEPYYPFIDKLDIKIIHCQTKLVLQASNIVLVASGTATLEAMLYKKPMIVGYKVSGITAWLVKHMVKTKYFSLPNILANQELVPELLQNNLNAKNCSDKLQQCLHNPNQVLELEKKFSRLHSTLMVDSNQKIQTTIKKLINTFN